jgi:hypothetical protein
MQSGDLAGAESLLIQASQAGYENPRIASNLAMVRGMRATSQPSPAPAAPPTAIASAPAAAKPVAGTPPRAQSKTEVASSVAAAQSGTPVSASTLGKTAQASGKPASARSNAAMVIQSSPFSAETLRAASAVLPLAAPKDGKTDIAPPKKTAKKDIPTALLLRPALTEGRPIALASDQTK